MSFSEKRYLSDDENHFRVEYFGDQGPIEYDDDVVFRHTGDSGAVVEIEELTASKTHESADAYRCERDALRFLHAQKLEGIPRLIHTNDSALRLTSERILGHAVDEQSRAAYGLRVWKNAGKWLRDLHTLEVAAGHKTRTFSEVMLARLRTSRAIVDPHIETPQRRQIDALEGVLDAGGISGGERVFAHRDFCPKNWFIRRDGAFFVLDFERAGADFAEWDLAALLPYWRNKPALRRAFVAAYRDPRLDVSDARLRAAQLVFAMESLAWAIAHEHREYLESRRELVVVSARDYEDGASFLEPA